MARQIEKIEFHNSREKQHNSWLRQAADALEVDLDDDLLIGKTNTKQNLTTFYLYLKMSKYRQLNILFMSTGRGRDEEGDREQQKVVKGMKKHLKQLISQPVFKNVIKTKYPTQMGKLSLPHMPLAERESALTRVSIQKMKQKLKKYAPPRQKKQKKKKTAAMTC